MSKATPVIASGAALAAVAVGGDQVANDALAAMIITTAVVIVLAVMGLLALLVIRARASGLTYRPDPGITRMRTCRAELVATYPARGPESNGAALPAIGADDAARTPERPARAVLAIGRGDDNDGPRAYQAGYDR